MLAWLSRSELLVGKEGIEKSQNAHILVVGLGGVGSFAAEFICRAGVGEITIVDGDIVDPTRLFVADLYDTYECLFAQYVRKRIKKLGVSTGIKAVFSTESVKRDSLILTDGSNFKRSAYGTISYILAAFGGICASVVIRELLGYPIDMVKRPKKFGRNQKRKALKKQSNDHVRSC